MSYLRITPMGWKRQKSVIYSRARTKIQRTYNTDTWRKAMHRLLFRMLHKKGKPMEDQATYFANTEKPIQIKDHGVSVIYINDNFLQRINSEHIEIIRGLDLDEVIEQYGLNEDESNVVRNMFRNYKEEVPLTGLGVHVESSDEFCEQTVANMIKGYRKRLTKNRTLSLFKFSYYKKEDDDIIRPTKSKSSGRIKDIFGWPLDNTHIPNIISSSFTSLKESVSHSRQHIKPTVSNSLKGVKSSVFTRRNQ